MRSSRLPVGGKRDGRDERERRGFVSLDASGYPAEHSSIAIGFATVGGKSSPCDASEECEEKLTGDLDFERLAEALSAPVRAK